MWLLCAGSPRVCGSDTHGGNVLHIASESAAGALSFWLTLYASNSDNSEYKRSCTVCGSAVIIRLSCWYIYIYIHSLLLERPASVAMNLSLANENKKTWRATFKKVLQATEVTWRKAKRLASDHTHWKKLTEWSGETKYKYVGLCKTSIFLQFD